MAISDLIWKHSVSAVGIGNALPASFVDDRPRLVEEARPESLRASWSWVVRRDMWFMRSSWRVMDQEAWLGTPTGEQHAGVLPVNIPMTSSKRTL